MPNASPRANERYVPVGVARAGTRAFARRILCDLFGSVKMSVVMRSDDVAGLLFNRNLRTVPGRTTKIHSCIFTISIYCVAMTIDDGADTFLAHLHVCINNH
jgi:hypothetical protein